MNINFSKGANTPLSFPLTSIPSNTNGSTIVSPKIGNTNGILNPITPSNIEEYYWEVIEVRNDVANYKFPHDFMAKYYPISWGVYEEKIPEPLIAENLRLSNPKDCANIVHMDSPIDVSEAVLTWVNSKGVSLLSEDTEYVNFLNLVPDCLSSIAMNTKIALDKAFEAKYYYGVARPEEVYKELSGTLNSTKMTAYPEGCPKHPSYPAGHGAAASGGINSIINHFDLNSDQIKECRDTAYHWAMYRTFAGVHYAPDNLAGLAVGGILNITEYNTFYWN